MSENEKPFRLIVEFETQQQMVTFAHECAGVPFQTDALDKVKCDDHTFILKDRGARPGDTEVK